MCCTIKTWLNENCPDSCPDSPYVSVYRLNKENVDLHSSTLQENSVSGLHGVVISTVASQQEGSWFKSQLSPLSCGVCMLWFFWLPLTDQNHVS